MKIPIIQRQESIPGVSGSIKTDVGSAGMVGRAMSGFGDSIANAGQTIGSELERRQKELQEQDDAIAAMNLTNAYDSDAQSKVDEITQKTGMESYDSKAQYTEAMAKAKENLLSGVSSPRVKMAVEKHSMSRDNHAINIVTSHEVGQRQKVADDAINNSLSIAKKDAGAGLVPLYDIMNNYSNRVSTLYVKGSYREDKASDAMVKGTQQIAEDYLQGIINRNPKEGIRIIEAGEMNAYLPQDTIDKYQKEAKTLKKALLSDADHAEKEAKAAKIEAGSQQVQDVRTNLDDMHLSDKLKEGDVHVQINSILRSNPDMPAAIKDKLNDLREKAINDIRHRRDYLDAKAKKAANGEDVIEGKANKNKFMAEALMFPSNAAPETVREFKSRLAQEVVSGRLKAETAKSIASEAEGNAKMDPIRNAQVRDVVSNLSKARTDGLFGKDKKEADIEHAKTLESFRAWQRDNPDKEPEEFYQQLMKPYIMKRVVPFTNIGIPGLGGEKVDVKARRQEMTGSPDINTWLSAARKANPTASDADLKAYYNKKYGGR